MSHSRPVPHVAAIHDLSGMGRCALTIVLPVLSAMGAWTSPLLTAWLRDEHTADCLCSAFEEGRRAACRRMYDDAGRKR